jgi:hypothetical protein
MLITFYVDNFLKIQPRKHGQKPVKTEKMPKNRNIGKITRQENNFQTI